MPTSLAVLRLHLPDGTVMERRVVEMDADGRVLRHRPLTHETPATPWLREDFYINADGYGSRER